MNSTPFRLRGAVFRGSMAVLVVGLTVASGCGQRGPLYLPESAPAADEPVQTGEAAGDARSTGDRETDGSADREDAG